MNASERTGEVYSHLDFENNYPGGMERHYWTLARNRILLSNIQRYLPNPGVIVDVGCGRGFTVDFLAARGYNCYGVEEGPGKTIETARDRVYTERRPKDLPEELREHTRTLLFLDVLEHVADPLQMIEEARAIFPGARRVMITVPARSELWSNYDETFGHYLRYSYEELSQLLDRAGIDPIRLRYFFHSLYVPMRLVSLLKRKRRISFNTPGFTRLHSLAASAFRWEAQLLPSRWPGSSLLAVGRL